MNVSLPSFPYSAIYLDNPLAIGFARISSVCDNVNMASGVAETLWLVGTVSTTEHDYKKTIT